jgi:hypothetical protein
MSSDTPLVVNLEVTVPRIIVATRIPHFGSSERETRGQDSEGSEKEDVGEQVRLVPLGQWQDTSVQQRSALQQEDIEAPLRMAHTVRFRLFRLQLPAQAQSFLLQVHRWRALFRGAEKRKATSSNHEPFYLSDNMTFSLEYRRSTEPGKTAEESTPTPTVVPGMNKVVIYLNSEGAPESFSIDGTES